MPAEQILRPEFVCDTCSLDAIPDGSLDFVIASHLIEHVHNPLKAMLAWHRVLKPRGLVLCIVPDARFTFDKGRPLTTLDHLLWDFINDGMQLKLLSDLFHIAECNLNMHASLTPDTAVDLAKAILAESYDTHFHVWTYDTFVAQLQTLIDHHHLPFRIRDSASDGQLEMLLLLEALSAVRPFIVDGDSVPRAQR